MPYEKKEDLPDNVKNSLPDHAQDIYLAAFNSAFDQYKDPSARNNDSSREETAHKVAWAAVKQSYEKDSDGNWIKC